MKSFLLGTAMVPALSVAAVTSTWAQETEEEDVIVVRGIRSALQDAIATKRDASAVIDAISAEDIGKFPDKNVAESLQRVTGITIQRDYGEGERVSIRGTASNRNLTQLNGHAVATADWFILDQLNSSRSFNYLLLPSEIVSKLTVYKSGQADIDEGGIGGVVNVETRKPLELDNFVLQGSAQGTFAELADETTPDLSGLLSWKNDEGTVGLLLSAIYRERELRRDGVEVLGYTDRAIDDQGGATLAVPDLIGSALFTQTRERTGFSGALQFKPNDKLDIVVNALVSDMEANNVNYNYLAWISNLSGAGEQPTDTTVGANNTLLSATYSGADGSGLVFDTIVRDASTSVKSYDVDVNYEFADMWNFHTKIGFTEADGATEDQPFWEVNPDGAATNDGVSYDLSSGVPEVNFTNIDPNTADEELVLGWASRNRVENFDEEFFAYADVEREFNDSVFTSVKAGLKFSDHEREVDVTYGQTRSLLDAAGSPACGGTRCTLATVAGGLTPSDFLDGIGGSGVLKSFLLADPAAIRGVYDQVTYGTDFPDFEHFGPLDSYKVQEEVFAAYVMGNFEVDRVRGNVGVRFVDTEQTVDGYSVGVAADTPGSFDNPFGRSLATQQTQSYSDVLPSANLVFELNEDWQLRASASRVMARPDYNQLGGAANLTPLLLTGSGGNPSLDPFRANAFDFGLEWYPDRDSILSVAFFYKDIGSYIINEASTERLPVSITDGATDSRVTDASNNCVATPTAGDPDLYTCDFQISRPTNGLGGENKGFEVGYQRPIGENFGIIANYTYSDAEAEDGSPIPENSKNSYNLTGYFENDMFSARLAYTYRDEYFINVDRGAELYSDSVESLDGSASWQVTPNFALTIDAVNLLDEELYQYYDNPGRPARNYKNGRIIYFGVRGEM